MSIETVVGSEVRAEDGTVQDGGPHATVASQDGGPHDSHAALTGPEADFALHTFTKCPFFPHPEQAASFAGQHCVGCFAWRQK